MVDNLQLLGGKQPSRNLKELAKELDIPVLLLSELTRAPEARIGGRPRPCDLRDAANLEPVADVIALLTRPEYYVVDEASEVSEPDEARLIVAKQRHGPVREMKLTFVKEFIRFRDYTS